jgi:hypothetical protein
MGRYLDSRNDILTEKEQYIGSMYLQAKQFGYCNSAKSTPCYHVVLTNIN